MITSAHLSAFSSWVAVLVLLGTIGYLVWTFAAGEE